MASFPKIKPEAQEIKSAAHFSFFSILPGLGWTEGQTGAEQSQRCLDCVVDSTLILAPSLMVDHINKW